MTVEALRCGLASVDSGLLFATVRTRVKMHFEQPLDDHILHRVLLMEGAATACASCPDATRDEQARFLSSLSSTPAAGCQDGRLRSVIFLGVSAP